VPEELFTWIHRRSGERRQSIHLSFRPAVVDADIHENAREGQTSLAISAVTSRAQASAKATVRRGRSYWPDKRMAAVESVVIVLEPSGDFSKALAKLESKVKIHGALKRGFSSIYGFTSDQEGIRHALLEAGTPAVDE